MNSRLYFWIPGCPVLQLGIGAAVDAHLYCVDNAADLNADLFAADTSSEDTTIRVQAGTYFGGFDYTRFTGNFSLNLEGDWDARCATQTTDASLTILDGNDTMSILHAATSSGTGDITIRYFDFSHGRDANFFNSALYAGAMMANVAKCRFPAFSDDEIAALKAFLDAR